MKKIFVFTLVLFFLLSACDTSALADSKSSIEITVPFARAVEMGGETVVYMDIKNIGPKMDTLLKVSCDAAMMVRVMETKMEGDVTSMSEIKGIDIPAGDTVELMPGGYHIMLMDLMQDLKEGSTVSITLEFQKAGKVTVKVPVKALGSMP